MSADSNVELVTVNIDGSEYQLPNGMNLVEAVTTVGKEIPHYCYHPKLSVSGNCRMCLVEMGMPMRDRGTGEPVLDDDGVQKIGWFPKPAIACNSNVSPGLHIKTESENVKDCRNGVMEFLLVNHPLDCPICDQAGECRLQEFATDYGRGYSRFVEEKNVKPKRTKLGPRVTLDDERCILCSRCVRFTQEVAKEDVLGFVDRGSYSTLTCYPGKELKHNYSLNTVDICPVGALTSTDFRFKMRVWFLKETKSICTESSVGANTEVSSREGKVYRITPRRNDDVNDTWMTDSGRDLYKQIESEDRLTSASQDGSDSSLCDALSTAASSLKGKKVAIVASARQSVEEQYLIKDLASSLSAQVHLVSHVGEEDGLLLSADRTPNMRGAFLSGLTKEYPGASLSALKSDLKSGKVEAVLVAYEDLMELGIDVSELTNVEVVYLGAHKNATSKVAKVALPGLTVFEKQGSFINQQFILQKFEQAVPGPSGCLPDIQLLNKLLSKVDGKEEAPAVSNRIIWDKIVTDIEEFKDVDYTKLPSTGFQLSPKRFLSVSFPEKNTLKYNSEKFKEEYNS